MPSLVEYLFGPGPGEKKRGAFETELAGTKASAVEAAHLAALKAAQDEEFRDLAKNIYIQEQAKGGPNWEQRAQDAILNLKTARPLANSGVAQLDRARAQEGMFNVVPEGEAARTGFEKSISENRYRTGVNRGLSPQLESGAINAEMRSREALGNLNTGINTARFNTAPERFGAEDVAATNQAQLSGARAGYMLPHVAEETKAITSGYAPEIEENANRFMMAHGTTPSDIAGKLELNRTTNEASLAAQKELLANPTLSRLLRMPGMQQVLAGLLNPNALGAGANSGINLGRDNPLPQVIVPPPTPGQTALPGVRRKVGEKPQ